MLSLLYLRKIAIVDLLMVFYLCLVVYGFELPMFVLLFRWIAKYIEDDYYDIRGTYLHNDAYNIIADIIEFIGIYKSDSNTDRIEKILNFIYDNIEYSEDINDEFLFPVEVLTYRSGDCDDFSILAAALFKAVGLDSAIGFFVNEEEQYHAMALIHLEDLGEYDYYYFSDLTHLGLDEGRWIIIEPQLTVENQDSEWIKQWNVIVTAAIN